MRPLGPFEPAPHLAVAVSGGPDSLALAFLAGRWAAEQGGPVTGLIVDHGLRPEAAAEAEAAVRALAALGIAPRILKLDSLEHGPALAARARQARYEALGGACVRAGILHLLLGHHAADQAETVLIRALGQSGPDGMAGMAAVAETHTVRMLRPLLGVPPCRLRATLQREGLSWSEDPSNADSSKLRPGLRLARRDAAGDGPATRALCVAASADGAARARVEAETARTLAECCVIRPEGFALVAVDRLPEQALSALVRTVAGRVFPPDREAVARLAPALRPATLGGVEIRRAGRLGPGFLLLREAAAMQGEMPARPGAMWDGRFRLVAPTGLDFEATVGPAGTAAARLRRFTALPASVLRTLPAIRIKGILAAVPPILYTDDERCSGLKLWFSPREPVACAPFVSSRTGIARQLLQERDA